MTDFLELPRHAQLVVIGAGLLYLFLLLWLDRRYPRPDGQPTFRNVARYLVGWLVRTVAAAAVVLIAAVALLLILERL